MKILLAIDDSEFSEAATQAALRQMRLEGTEVCILHVVDVDLSIPFTYAKDVLEESVKQGKELLQRTEQMFVAAGYKAETAIEEGYPRSKIIDYAAHWNADLIIVGSHGRRGLDRFMMGSVAESVVRHARCSVLIVRIPSAR